MRMRERPKIDVFVRQYNPIFRKVVSEYWGTVNGFRCKDAAKSLKRDIPGPAGIVARSSDRVFARFRRPRGPSLNQKPSGR
jgi:hypothetical protein